QVEAYRRAVELYPVVQQDFFQAVVDRQFFLRQLDLVHLRDVQDLADQRLEAFGLPLDDVVQRLQAALGLDELFVLHRLVGDDDGGQGGMELVGDAVDE